MCSVRDAVVARAALFARRVRRPHPVDVAVGTQSVAIDAAAKERRLGAIGRQGGVVVTPREVASAARENRCRATVHTV